MRRGSEGVLLVSLGVLLALTATSFGASYLVLGPPWEMIVAMSIALAKVGVVAVAFMRLSEAPPAIRATALLVPVFVLIFVGLVYADVATRLEPDVTSRARVTAPRR